MAVNNFTYERDFMLKFRERCVHLPKDALIPDEVNIHFGGGKISKYKDPFPSIPFETRWVRPTTRTDDDAFKRNAQSLTNKLTMDNFPSISNKMLDLLQTEMTEVEEPVKCLNTIVEILFEKAVRELNFCDCYSDLCVFLSLNLPPVPLRDPDQEESVVHTVNFHRILVNKCQREFEQKQQIPEPDGSMVDLEERFALEEARNKLMSRNLGVPKFIGSLFLHGLLTEKIVHCCLFTLLSMDEADLANFASLMTTVGKRIDHPKAGQLMDTYFLKLRALSVNPLVSSRIRFKLKDLIDLRDNSWALKRPTSAPKTIAEVHRDAETEKINKEIKMEKLNRDLHHSYYPPVPLLRHTQGPDPNRPSSYQPPSLSKQSQPPSPGKQPLLEKVKPIPAVTDPKPAARDTHIRKNSGNSMRSPPPVQMEVSLQKTPLSPERRKEVSSDIRNAAPIKIPIIKPTGKQRGHKGRASPKTQHREVR